jgi:sec-independent protein translocase protein TatA
MGLSLPHILIFAVIAILLLGGGRFSNMMGDVAKGVKNFKKGMAEEDHEITPVTPAKPQLIEGKTAAEIIAEHERQKAAAAAAAVQVTPTPPAPPAA